MKLIQICIIATFFTSIQVTVSAQGTFQNLNFEQASLYLTPVFSGQYGGSVPISEGLPGWTGYLGTDQASQVLENNLSLGAASIDIEGPYFGYDIIDGQYSAVLQSGGSSENPDVSVAAGIGQVGTVPSYAQSLQFSAFGADFSVSFAGNMLSPVALSSGTDAGGQTYYVYAANVSSYAGDTGQLLFSANPANAGYLVLDDISFSPTAVPEPSPLILGGISGLLFALRWRLTKRQ